MRYSTQPSYSAQKPAPRWRLWLVALTLITALITVAFIWSFAGNRAQIAPQASRPAESPPADKQYVGKFVSFTYGGIYNERSHSTGTNFEQIVFKADTSYEKTISLEVMPLPQGGVAGDSGYNYRQTHTELYQSQQLNAGGGSSIVEWAKRDGSDRTVYITHGDQVAIVSLSVANTNDTGGLPAEEAALLKSFQWK